MPRFIIVDEGTIREHGDEEESPRSKKRQRVDEDEPSNEKLRKIVSDGTEILIHDPHYHLRDDPQADCYVRVEKVLFKVRPLSCIEVAYCLTISDPWSFTVYVAKPESKATGRTNRNEGGTAGTVWNFCRGIPCPFVGAICIVSLSIHIIVELSDGLSTEKTT